MKDLDLFFNFVSEVLEDESREAEKNLLLSQFIAEATSTPASIQPELIFFAGVLLKRLKQADFKDARKSLGLPSKKTENKTRTLLANYQLIADVDYLVRNGRAQGAEGACKLLSDESPHYSKKDQNSLQATYRDAVKKSCNWWKIEEDNILDLDPDATAIKKGRKIVEASSIFHVKRDPLK